MLVNLNKQGRLPDTKHYGNHVHGSMELGLAMEGLVCEIEKDLNITCLTNEAQVGEEVMVVDATNGATTSN